MASLKDYYDILGIRRGATEEEIEKAYRKLARAYQVDTYTGNREAEIRFREIAEAYAVLSDKEKRVRYDQAGLNFSSAESDREFEWEEEICNFEGFEEFFEESFGKESASNSLPQKGKEIHQRLKIGPGQPGGMHTLTGLAHDRASKVAYDPAINEEGLRMRSLKLAALQKTLTAPPVVGGDDSDLLLVGWGSTMGAIEEAVARLRAEGLAVSSMHLRFLQPMPSGIREILKRFKRVMTIEGNWSDKLEDELIDEDNRRYSALAMMLRSRFLVDIDCWSEERGQPIKPGDICRVAKVALQRKGQAS